MEGLGLGLEFTEVSDRSEAEVRIAFDQSDGSWSYVGRDVLGISASEPTMKFGWDLTDDYGHTTALPEIGHTLGMPHEHQNPCAGIVWDEPKVYQYFAGAPNHWTPDQTLHNVVRNIAASEVEGSTWDPDSVMESWLPAGLIKEPHVSSVPLSLAPGGQADFSLEPQASRKYEIATFGTADTVLVLFEEVNGELRFVADDDDSGEDGNSRFSAKLCQGRSYVARVRLYRSGESGQQPSCTGRSDRRLRPASRRRQRNQQNTGWPVATLIIRVWYQPAYVRGLPQGPGQPCSMKAILTKPYA